MEIIEIFNSMDLWLEEFLINFKNTVIILTSNLGSQYLSSLKDNEETEKVFDKEKVNNDFSVSISFCLENFVKKIPLTNKMFR